MADHGRLRGAPGDRRHDAASTMAFEARARFRDPG